MPANETTGKTEQGLKRSRESWFNKITGLFQRNQIDEDTWESLEELLISADVGVATTGKLLERVRQRAREEKATEGALVELILKQEMINLLRPAGNGKSQLQSDKINILLIVGVNGSGKTTSIAKLAGEFRKEGKQVLLAAADTFRAAAIDQLKLWGERIGVQVIAHQPGADPGAVVFDAIQAAQNRNSEVVIVDTAGRLHTKFNLMEELKKIRRVIGKYDLPQEIVLVIDATTGQNGLIQARNFTQAVGVNSIILSKLDGTAKGGIVLAISDELKIPISYIGTGEQPDDLVPFKAEEFVDALFAR